MFWKAVTSILGGGILGPITESINKAYQAKLNAKNTTERIEADQQLAVLHAQRDVLISEQRDRLTKWIRPAFAAPFAIYIWKIIVWDKVLGLGVTDPLPDFMLEIMMGIIGAYFMLRPFERRGRSK